MTDMETALRAFTRAEWMVLALSGSVFVGAGLTAAIAHHWLTRRRLRLVGFATFLTIYAMGTVVYLRVFENQYVRVHRHLLRTIPGPHGAADPAMANYIARTNVSGLRELPPDANLLAYPSWVVFAVPSVIGLVHTLWMLWRGRTA